MVVSNRGNLDTTCTFNVSPDLMMHRWAFLAKLDSPPPVNPSRSHGFLPKETGAELRLADEVVVAGLVLALLRPRNGEDVHVGSGIQSLSSVGCNHQFSVHDPYGTHSIWYCLFVLGLTLSKKATSEIFHVALRVGPVTLRLSRGCIFEVNTVAAAQVEVVPGDL